MKLPLIITGIAAIGIGIYYYFFTPVGKKKARRFPVYVTN
jgi:hypothetical protein